MGFVFAGCAKQTAVVVGHTPVRVPRHFADLVVQANGAIGIGTGDPKLAANGVRGAGNESGSFDVFSLDKTGDGELVLAWSQGTVCDEPGPDLVVFENAFRPGGSASTTYFEPAVVSVSADGKDFFDFPHRYLGLQVAGGRDPLRVPGSRIAKDWIGFAGMQPVHYHEENFGGKRTGGRSVRHAGCRRRHV